MEEITGDSGKKWFYDSNMKLGKPGGFGIVYRGESEEGKEVAIKFIRKTLLDGTPLDTGLYKREADIARNLPSESEYLIRHLDVAWDGDDLYLVMERAERALEIPVDGMADDDVIEILKDVCKGLDELHQAPIAHRDLKPNNILYYDGKWKLADFGISKNLLDSTQDPTFKGAGTPPYMAPEIWQMHSLTVKSDLYALGCVIYEMVTGKPPFEGPDYRAQHITERPPDLSGDVNPILKDIVVRLLRKDPKDRYHDSQAILKRLNRISVPFNESQKDLQNAMAVSTEEKQKVDAKRGAAKAEEERRRNFANEGIADLEELIADAMDNIGAAIGDEVEQRGERYEIELVTSETRLAFRTWVAPILPPDDTAVAGGEVRGLNLLNGEKRLLANIVFEEIDGRYDWYLYRFTVGPTRDAVTSGSPEGPHGFNADAFWRERGNILNFRKGISQIWKLSATVLDVEGIVKLFTEVVKLFGPSDRETQ